MLTHEENEGGGCVRKGWAHGGFDGFFVLAVSLRRRRERDTATTRPWPDGSMTDGGNVVASGDRGVPVLAPSNSDATRPPAARGRLGAGVIRETNQPAERWMDEFMSWVMKSTAVRVGV